MKYNVKNACERNNSLSLYLQRIVMLFSSLFAYVRSAPVGFTLFHLSLPASQYRNRGHVTTVTSIYLIVIRCVRQCISHVQGLCEEEITRECFSFFTKSSVSI